MNHGGVSKTAPATPGLLNTVNWQLSLSLALFLNAIHEIKQLATVCSRNDFLQIISDFDIC